MKTRKIPLGEFLRVNKHVPASIAFHFVKRSRQRIGQILEAGFVTVEVIEGIGFVSIEELNRYLVNARPGRKPYAGQKRKKARHEAEQKSLL